jgi:hypothetical protein
LALKAGIQQASVSQTYVYGPNEEQDQVNIQTDTPSARKFLDNLLSASYSIPTSTTSLQTISGAGLFGKHGQNYAAL